MIVKNIADTERWMAQDGICGTDGEFCSQSCQEHGAHVAIANGHVFARGLKPQRASHLEAENETIVGQVAETITFGRTAVAV